jgi:hypothetical protein
LNEIADKCLHGVRQSELDRLSAGLAGIPRLTP